MKNPIKEIEMLHKLIDEAEEKRNSLDSIINEWYEELAELRDLLEDVD